MAIPFIIVIVIVFAISLKHFDLFLYTHINMVLNSYRALIVLPNTAMNASLMSQLPFSLSFKISPNIHKSDIERK